MDLEIAGKKAIVCASSRGLGRGCALALAEAGCELVLNGRDAATLAKTAEELRRSFSVEVTEIVADVSSRRAKKRCSRPAQTQTFWSTTMAALRDATSAN